MNSEYERRCRLLLRAYPLRYRQFRGEELLGTLLDTAPPHQDLPTLRTSWDIIRGGLLFRLRDHPPLHSWVAYRMTDRRLPYGHRWWARDDLVGRFYEWRHTLTRVLMLYAVLIGVGFVARVVDPLGRHPGHWALLLTLAGLAGCLVRLLSQLVPAWRDSTRRSRAEKLARYEFYPDGTSWQSPPSQPPPAQTPRRVPPARP